MSTSPLPPLEPEIEALLWLQRAAAAEEWEECWDEPVIVADGPQVEHEHRWDAAASRREEILYEWRAAAEQIARWQGAQVRLLGEAMDLAFEDGTLRPDAELSVRSLAAELACAVGVADRTVEQRMNDALVLRDRFPRTMATLSSGGMSLPHARVVADEGTRLDDDAVRARYEAVVLGRAAGLTAGRLRVMAASIAEELMPASIAERHADARTQRRVTVRDVEDGMAELWALLPSVLAHGIHDRLTRMARTVKNARPEGTGSQASAAPDLSSAGGDGAFGRTGSAKSAVGGGPGNPDAANDREDSGAPSHPDDERTIDQLRADAFCDLALTGHSTVEAIDRDGGDGIDALRGIVQITVPFQTLVGDDGPAPLLTGRCPIDPESARRLLGSATLWDRVLTDPVTGGVVAVDRRFPSEAQRRHLRARDEHCRFPGCRMAVWRCDVDHTVDHQHGGATEPCNLAHLCRRHHTLKHHTAWQVEQRPGGVLVWTSPLGRAYTDRPSSSLRFVPSRE